MSTPSRPENPFLDPPSTSGSAGGAPQSPPNESPDSSAATSRPVSRERDPRMRHRVRFSGSGGSSADFSTENQTPNDNGRQERSRSRSKSRSPGRKSSTLRVTPGNSAHARAGSGSHSSTGLLQPKPHPPPTLVDTDLSADIADSPASPTRPTLSRPRPSIIRQSSYNSTIDDITEEDDDSASEDNYGGKAFSALSAQERAQRLAMSVGSYSAPGSRVTSPVNSPPPSPLLNVPRGGLPVRIDDIPLIDINEKPRDEEEAYDGRATPQQGTQVTNTSIAHRIIRSLSKRGGPDKVPQGHAVSTGGLRSGQVTPVADRDPEVYVPPPQEYRPGILSALLKYNGGAAGGFPSGPGIGAQHTRKSSALSGVSTPGGSPGSSGRATPGQKHQKWYHKSANQSTSSLANLVTGSSSMLATPGAAAGSLPTRPQMKGRSKSSQGTFGYPWARASKPRLEDEIRITIHIAETLARQRYLLKLCRALMQYGAPTHRLEEYMRMSARVLEIDSQYLYIPGCMICSFDDASTHTTEVKMVRANQGVDLGKLRDTHEIYKEVVHDVIGVEEATQRLDEVMKRPPKHHPLLLVIVYGFASASVGPFAFGARFIDLPIAFVLGCVLGVLQLIVAPRSELYSNVFEISAAVATSFLARAFGSIRGGDLFCFSALAQSSIALILPGYIVLCGSLELQSRSIVAGSVRMIYAIIYSLFLGFGITIGTVIYGLLDPNATSDRYCRTSLPQYYGFFFVPIFTMCLIVINQAKWKQAPVMLIISFAGYVVNYFSNKRFGDNAQIANTLGALAIGVLGNLYSRLRHGLAAAALLPAIFVQVPSGLAAGGSLISGITSADEIIANVTHNSTYSTTTTSSSTDINNTVFNVGYNMIQVAIGITVGLFLSALVVYPFGKRRSGLFSF